MIGTILLKFTVSLLILDLIGSAALFGTITALNYIPPVFLSPIAGILADRKNKKCYGCFRWNVLCYNNYICALNIIVKSDRFKVSKIYQLFLIMGVAVLLYLSATTTYIIFVIVGVVIFVTASIAWIFIISAIQRNVLDNMLGRVMSFYSA